jgi:nitroreductase
MDVFSCIQNRNSIRRFTQDPIDISYLHKIIQAVRIAPSAANLQPLKYIIINDEDQCNKIFPFTSWAGYIKPSWRPEKHERPTAYIAILNTQLNNVYVDFDVGISMAYIVLIAQALGLGSCILCKLNRLKICEILKIPESIELKALIALGKPQEIVKREEDGINVKYWRDENNIFHIPKKPFTDIIFEQRYHKF